MPNNIALSVATAIALWSAALRPSPADAQVRDSVSRPAMAPGASAVPGLRPARTVPDSLQPPLSPGRAFLNSMLLPGLGQARLQRQVPGAVYFAVEALSFTMLFKTGYELRIAKVRSQDVVVARYQVDPATGAPVLNPDGHFIAADSVENFFDAELVNARRSQFEDWVALIVFNHLFSGADAFVSSLLWDLPRRVGFRPAPFGMGVAINIRW